MGLKITRNRNNAPKQKTARNVRDTIPYISVYDNTDGIIQSAPGFFTKTQYVPDANFTWVSEETQENICDIYKDLLDSVSSNCMLQLTLHNRPVQADWLNQTLSRQYQGDQRDTLRKDINERIFQAITDSNNLKTERYLTIGVDATDVKAAEKAFELEDRNIQNHFSRINGTGVEALPLDLRLELLHDAYNPGKEGTFLREKLVSGQKVKSLDLEALSKYGKQTKDIIGPTSITFKKKVIELDEGYACALYCKDIPSTDYLDADILNVLTNIQTASIISLQLDKFSEDKAQAWALSKDNNVRKDIQNAEKQLVKDKSSDITLISSKLQLARSEADELLDNVRKGDALYNVTLTAVLYAANEEDLSTYVNQLIEDARRKGVKFEIMYGMQEAGFNATLPLALSPLRLAFIMESSSVSAFVPFRAQEMLYKDGNFLGYNTKTKAPIQYSRLRNDNYNGAILGNTGKGKSLMCKDEIVQTMCESSDNVQIIVLDPNNEYGLLAKSKYLRDLSTVARPSPGSDCCINPLDLDISQDSEKLRNPLAEKSNYVLSLIEMMANGTLDSSAAGVLDAVLMELYEPYVAQLKASGKSIDTDICPTLEDLYYALKAKTGKEGQIASAIADAFRLYAIGSQNTFAHKTQIDTKAKMIVFDISAIGDEKMKQISLNISTSFAYNTTIANHHKGIRTHVYIDEVQLLLRNPHSALFVRDMYTMTRKFSGQPTAMTQYISTLLETEEGCALLKASDQYMVLLPQAGSDIPKLQELFNIDDSQAEYIAPEAPAGTGLLIIHGSIIPFTNLIPTSSEMYKLLSTKPEDAEKMKGIFA